MWPGFGENLRVLRWVIDRCEGKAAATETPVGYVPAEDAIDTRGLNVPAETMRALLTVDHEKWRMEMNALGEYFDTYGTRLPRKLRDEHARVLSSLKTA